MNPFEQCKRFDRCSVNSCPLDPDQEEHESLPGDPETKCRASRAERLEIAKDFDLPRGGLTVQEYAQKNRMESMTSEERKKHSNVMRRNQLARMGKT